MWTSEQITVPFFFLCRLLGDGSDQALFMNDAGENELAWENASAKPLIDASLPAFFFCLLACLFPFSLSHTVSPGF